MRWKLFAGLNVLLGIGALIEIVERLDLGHPADIIDLVIIPLSTLGLLAYAFDWNRWRSSLWKPFSLIAGVWWIVCIAIGAYRTLPLIENAPTLSHQAAVIIGILLGAIFDYFQWLALWRYGQQQPASNCRPQTLNVFSRPAAPKQLGSGTK